MLERLSDPKQHAPRLANALTILLVSIPLLSLGLAALSWLRFGIDLPFWDDWRDYREGTQGSFALTHIFDSANDTLYAVGRLLDSLAYRFLDGNSVGYQLLSMLSVLGLLLVLQWRLLRFVTGERLMAASAFSLTVLMLQPDTYWGMQNIAYHQAIPLVCVLAVLDIVVRRQMLLLRHSAIIVLLGLMSGFSYISGAFAVLTLALVFLVLHQLPKLRTAALKSAGVALLIPGVVTTLAQVWVIAVKQKGTHVPGNPLTLPTTLDFWAFLLGKIARSLMLPVGFPVVSLILTLLVVGGVVAALVFALRSHGTQQGLAAGAVVYVGLLSVVFVYLLLIAAGRTSFRSPDIDTGLELFSLGFKRFHFFWATLLWPWAAALAFVALRQRPWLVLLPLLALPAMIHAGALAHTSYYRTVGKAREDGLACLQRAYKNGTDMRCPQIAWTSLSKAFRNASRSGASFVRLVPNISDAKELESLVFTVSDWRGLYVENVAWKPLARGPGIVLEPGHDPLIKVELDPDVLNDCRNLRVVASLKVSQPDDAQIFFLPNPNETFTEAATQVVHLAASGEYQMATFNLHSDSGFRSPLRLDPVMKAQAAEVNQIEVYCH